MEKDKLEQGKNNTNNGSTNEELLIQDLVNFLDQSVAKGVGHINVEADENAKELKTVETLGCSDCEKGNLACRIPNLSTGIEES